MKYNSIYLQFKKFI